MKKIFENIGGDKVIWMIVLILSFFSLLAVYSSTGTLAYHYHGGHTEYYLLKHLSILLLGLVLMYATHIVPYKYYSRIAQILIYLSVPLLLLTLLTGTNLNEASRWLTLPVINLSFQTSDLAKLALIMYVARLLSKKQDDIKDLKSAFLPIMLPIIITVALILPANFSTSAVLFATSLVILFIGRINLKYIFSIIGIGVFLFLILIMIAKVNPNVLPRLDTWMSRIENFNNADSEGNFQAEQAKIAISTGNFFGKMPGNSIQRNFLPHPYSDFIFAIIVEEYGMLGSSFIILLYLILLYRAVRIASNSPGTFGAFLSIGLAFSLVFQAMINMMVAVNLLPVTGQPLPLLSMGGTSIWFTSISIGIILSVSRESMNKNQEDEAA
ncbi:MAG: cell division protein FtsW [Bacteroidetes bacterium CG2_30_33_31]|nr:MAG: cell division protein FtsW [Bacteroidetes bacterium CG2_30_33_31]